jgi:dephospho-CoA kinase
MIRVGLTGGIGSGKSVVAMVFSHLGVPVYHADAEAKKLYYYPEVLAEVINAFGNEVVDHEGILDRKKLAGIVFTDPVKLAKLNAIIHPHVEDDFRTWFQSKEGNRLIIHEAAILFESGFDRFFDKTIVVTAPEELCIKRVMQRDGISRGEVERRMKNQWDAGKKAALADYVLTNDEHNMLLPQVLELYDRLISL